VQLIAETAIDLVNDSDRRELDAALLERALAQAIVKGHSVLHELSRRESRLPGEWEYLRGFAGSERQPPPADPRVYASLVYAAVCCSSRARGNASCACR
jgi:hypothetical protein